MIDNFSRFPDYLADSVAVCSRGHARLYPTPEKARESFCPRCLRAQATAQPRTSEPDAWAGGASAERVKRSRQRGVERSREVRNAS